MSEFGKGWKPLIACTVGTACGVLAVTFYTQSLFVGPVTTDLGWGRGEFLLGFTVLMMMGIVTGPVIGSLVHKHGAKPLVAAGLVGHCLGYFLLALNPGSLLLWYLSFAALAVLGAGTLPVTFTHVVNSWFLEHRGKAIGIMMAGTGLTAFAAPPLVEFAISEYGWRAGYALLGAGATALSLPLALFFLKEPRDNEAADAGGNAAMRKPLWGVDRGEALKSYRFWAIGLALTLVPLSIVGLLPNYFPIMTDAGIDRDVAASIMSGLGIFVILGRLIAGFLVDRVWAPLVGAGFFALPVLAILAILLFPLTPTTALMASAALGLALGAELDLLAYTTSRYFGTLHFGRVFGGVYVFFAVASGLAPAIYGGVFDLTGSYDAVLLISLFMLAASVVLMLSLGRYPDFFTEKSAASNPPAGFAYVAGYLAPKSAMNDRKPGQQDRG